MALLAAACGDEAAPVTPSPVRSTPAPTATAAPSPTPAFVDAGYDPVQTMDAMFDAVVNDSWAFGPASQRRLAGAMEAARRNNDASQVPVLIELMRFILTTELVDEIAVALHELTGQDFGGTSGDWIEWEEWLGVNLVDYLPPDGYVEWKLKLFDQIDPEIAALLATAKETSTVDFTEVLWGGSRLRDIVDMRSPPSVPGSQAAYLLPDDRIIGVSINGEHRAYPLRVLGRHENANDELGGERIVVAYCPLCSSGIVYSAKVNGEQATFGSAALIYRSTNLIFDRATRTVWSQFTGEPVIGPLSGGDTVLFQYPSVLTTWGEWLAEHPDTTALSIETGLGPPDSYLPDSHPGALYGDYAALPALLYPVWNQSAELEAKEIVVGVAIEDQLGAGHKAYPLSVMRRKRIVNDQIGQTDYVVISSATTDSVKVYERRGRFFGMGGAVASSKGFPTELIDRTTGARWHITEDALVNTADPGQSLDRLPGVTSYWFAWHTIHPNTRAYRFEEGG